MRLLSPQTADAVGGIDTLSVRAFPDSPTEFHKLSDYRRDVPRHTGEQ